MDEETAAAALVWLMKDETPVPKARAALDAYRDAVLASVCGDDHCFVGSSEMLLTFPPQSVRTCKHCGLRQTGRPQESIVWT